MARFEVGVDLRVRLTERGQRYWLGKLEDVHEVGVVVGIDGETIHVKFPSEPSDVPLIRAEVEAVTD
jgi:ribosome maturation factor RimP